MRLPFRMPFRKRAAPGPPQRERGKKICDEPHTTVVASTKLSFVVPMLEDCIRVVVGRPEIKRKFSDLCFILKDEEPQPSGTKQQLFKLITETEKTEAGAIAYFFTGSVIQVNTETFTFLRANVYFNVDIFVRKTLEDSYTNIFQSLKQRGNLPDDVEMDAIATIQRTVWQNFLGVFIHEFAHAVQDLNRQCKERLERAKAKLKLIEARREKLLAQEPHKASSYTSSYSVWLSSYRAIMENFVLEIHAEGLADYYKMLLTDTNFPGNKVETLKSLYNDALLMGKKPLSWLKEAIEVLPLALMPKNAKLTEGIPELIATISRRTHKIAYNVGLHMFYTIAVGLNVDDDFLLEMRLGQFMMLYEQACEKLHIEPLVSLSSGKGKLFDYKEMLRLLYRAERVV